MVWQIFSLFSWLMLLYMLIVVAIDDVTLTAAALELLILTHVGEKKIQLNLERRKLSISTFSPTRTQKKKTTYIFFRIQFSFTFVYLCDDTAFFFVCLFRLSAARSLYVIYPFLCR